MRGREVTAFHRAPNAPTSGKTMTPSFDDLRAAAQRIRPFAVETPLVESAAINKRVGGRVLLKAEVLQATGSFKFRGACNRLLQFDLAERRAGVVTFSSGNHALAIAAVAQKLGIPATILMPSDAPRAKIDGTRANGASVCEYDRKADDREAIAAKIVSLTGAVFVPPYDDFAIIAGQGTVGLEIARDLERVQVRADMLLLPHSGGGLAAGAAIALRTLGPDTSVLAVEPAAFDDLGRSLISGQRENNSPLAHSICDALQVSSPGALTFSINRQLLAGALTVTDDEVREAMRVAYHHLKLVVEPGGAVALAAILAQKIDVRGKAVVGVLSGGNVDSAEHARYLSVASLDSET